MLAIAAGLAYGNAAVGLQPPQLRAAPIHLPAPGFVIDCFLMTGMFNSYSDLNHDPFIAGLRTERGVGSDRGRWVELPLAEHFAQRQGVVFTELFSAHEWDMHGPPAQRRAWSALARRIRERHNRMHPERTVARVAFGSVGWRQSPLGYRARKTEATPPEPWFVEADSAR